MSIASFIPELWDAGLLTSFREQAIAAALANREYEGTLTRGNSVNINYADDIEIKDYKAGVVDDPDNPGSTLPRTTAPDAVSTTSESLDIDQEKSFDFLVDDIDRRQAAGSLEVFTRGAGLSLAEDADQFLLALMASSAASKVTDTVTETLTGTVVHDVIGDLRKTLNQKKVPKANRVLFMNSEFEAALLRADAKLTSVDTSGTSEGLREAVLGRYLGFTIYSTENLPEVEKPFVMAVYLPTVHFVSQITETEAMRDQRSFSDRLRGLHVYGAKVIRGGIGIATYTYEGPGGG